MICSKMKLTSAFVQVRDRTDEIMYRRRLMHSEAAGIPTDQPMSSLVAEERKKALIEE